jgi:hypothetical protein
MFTGGLMAFFILRIIFLQGFYVIAYIQGNPLNSGLFSLQCVISFLTPLGAPDIEDESAFENLPVDGSDFANKPLVRNISEFKFW